MNGEINVSGNNVFTGWIDRLGQIVNDRLDEVYEGVDSVEDLNLNLAPDPMVLVGRGGIYRPPARVPNPVLRPKPVPPANPAIKPQVKPAPQLLPKPKPKISPVKPKKIDSFPKPKPKPALLPKPKINPRPSPNTSSSPSGNPISPRVSNDPIDVPTGGNSPRNNDDDDEKKSPCDTSDQVDKAGHICGGRAATVRPNGKQLVGLAFYADDNRAATDTIVEVRRIQNLLNQRQPLN